MYFAHVIYWPAFVTVITLRKRILRIFRSFFSWANQRQVNICYLIADNWGPVRVTYSLFLSWSDTQLFRIFWIYTSNNFKLKFLTAMLKDPYEVSFSKIIHNLRTRKIHGSCMNFTKDIGKTTLHTMYCREAPLRLTLLAITSDPVI